MNKKKSYLFHYALLIYTTCLLSFWFFRTLIHNSSGLTSLKWLEIPTILSLCLSLFITLVSMFLFSRHSRWTSSITKALNRLAAGNWETIPESHHPIISSYNQAVINLQNILREHEHQKEQLRQDINKHSVALKDSGIKLNQAMLELKNTQTQMAQTEKHRSLTAVVSGFAHEINNPLTGILGYIELMELQTDLTEQTHKRINSIKAQALRIKGIISDLSQLDPDGKQVKMPINISNLLEKLVKISLSKHPPPFVTIKCKLYSDESLVYGNHFALWQVFEGLIENAVEACLEKENSKRHILIETKSSPDRKTIITIKDTGSGFKDPQKAFDPFYTTKNRAHKRGIGLSLAYKIVVEHGGNITIKNHEQGALVTIVLPLQAPTTSETEKKRLSEEPHA